MVSNHSKRQQVKTHLTASADFTSRLQDEFEKDGVVVIRELFSKKSIDKLKSSLLAVRDEVYPTRLLPDKIKRIKRQGIEKESLHSACNVWKCNLDIKNFVLTSELGEIARILMNWNSCRVNQDTFFV